MPSEAVDVDVGQFVYPSLKDCPVVVDLHELSPVDRRATGRQVRWTPLFGRPDTVEFPWREAPHQEQDVAEVVVNDILG